MVEKRPSTSPKNPRNKTSNRKKDYGISTKQVQADHQINHLLIENFVGLQKAMTNLSIKFESLSNQISRLLEIYEISAKNFSEIDLEAGDKNSEEVLNKVNALIEQNKTLAKGLVLIDERLKEKPEPHFQSLVIPTPSTQVTTPYYAQPLPRQTQPIQKEVQQAYVQSSQQQFQQNSGEQPKPKPLPRI